MIASPLSNEINEISVVLICLNDEDCIEEMLKSIMRSDYRELINN